MSNSPETISPDPCLETYLRSSPRIGISRLKLPIWVMSVGEEGPWLMGLRDISLDGIGLVTRRPFPIDSLLTLEWPMRFGQLCRSARVVNLRPVSDKSWAVGCQFVEALSDGDLLVQRSSRLVATTRERRRQARYTTRIEGGPCRVLSMAIDGPWSMTAQNVSETGIGLIADRPFKSGMLLNSELPRQPNPTSLRVVHSFKKGNIWLVGCAFPQAIPHHELRQFA